MPGIPRNTPLVPRTGSVLINNCVYGCKGSSKMVLISASSAKRPAYITASCSTDCAMSPMSCPISIIEMPNSC